MADSLEGVYDPLTAEQAAKVADLLQQVQGLEMPPSYKAALATRPTLFLTKFLVARKWVTADAFTMFRDAAAWRIEQGIETKPLFPTVVSVKGWDEEELRAIHGTGVRPTDQFVDKAKEALKTVGSSGWHKWDRHGRPVYIERTGLTRVREVVDRCRELMPPGEPLDPVVVEPHMQSNEVGRVLIEAQNRKLEAEGRRVAQVTVIMDCAGLTMSSFYGPAMELMKANGTIDQKYFPEGLHKTYVVNAPKFIKIGWNMVRLWFDRRIQEKVVFCAPGDATREMLSQVIEPQNLPDFLGGTCKCEGGCLPELAPYTGGSGDRTIELVVPARSVKTHVVAVQKDTEFSWNFTIANGNDIGFGVLFKDADEMEAGTAGDGTEVIPAQRIKSDSGKFTAPNDGAVTLRFDNSYSWMKSKTLHLRASN